MMVHRTLQFECSHSSQATFFHFLFDNEDLAFDCHSRVMVAFLR